VSEELPEHQQFLNPEQFKAVTETGGPMLILAGAGSGKTRVLTRRIAQLLHEGVDPKSILAVTFTNKAASEMKERVQELVGEAGKKVWVSTFHSSCCRILRQDIEHLGYTQRFSIYDDDDQKRIVRGLLDELNIDRKAHPPKSFLSQIDFHKNRGRGPDEVLKEHRGHDVQTLLRVWRRYEESLLAADALDFNDLIGKVVILFRDHAEVREKWQERFKYVLVDEYQDTNRLQYALLRVLAEPQQNIAVVGDDDQSIYGFRGADITNILSFEKDYQEANVIRLERNYRSTPNILAVSNALVAKNKGRMEKRLWTEGDPGSKVRMVRRANARDEAEWVADAAQLMQRRGAEWEDIAVIYRTNATSRVFEQAMQRRGIPYRIVGGRKFYARREVRDILCYLRQLTNPADDAAFLRVCNVPTRGIGSKGLGDLRKEASTRGEPLLGVAKGMTSGSARSRKAIGAYAELIESLTKWSHELTPAELVAKVIKESGYQAMLSAEKTRESEGRLENLNQLCIDAADFEHPDPHANDFETLAGWLDSVALTGQDEQIPDGGLLTLMTVHNSKGLEYPIVFVVHMMEKQFPHARSLDEEGGVEEERRLAYVAFTRAKQQLIITYNLTGPSFDYASRGGPSDPAEPSRFLFGLPGECLDGDLPDVEPHAAQVQAQAIRKKTLHDQKLQAFIERQKENAAVEAEEPEDLRLMEVESMDQISAGVRVHHPRFGVGTVRMLRGRGPVAQVFVAFSGGRTKSVRLGDPSLQLVID
jgi:DNA helicase-2/ATP-dependent DNA helicase PcrA